MEVHISRIDLERNYSERETFVHKMDARVKTISILILLFTIVSMKDLYVPIAMLAFCILMLKKLGIKFKKLFYPSTIVATIFILILFTYGGERVIWEFWVLKVTFESLHFAFLIFLRVLACLALLYIYISTTRISEALASLSWLRFPKTLIDLSYLMIRFVSNLSRDAEKMYFAAKSKHAFSNSLPYFKRIKNFGIVAGSLFLRALDRADRVYLGLLSKGYGNNLRIFAYKKLRFRDLAQLIAISAFAAASVYIDRVIL